MDNLLFWEIIDSSILLIEIVLVLVFIYRMKVFWRYRIVLFLIFILTISSYNILVIPFHYYHFFLLRTLVYDDKLVFLGLLLLILIFLIKDLKIILRFIRGSFLFYYFLIGILSIVSFSLSFVNDWSNVDQWISLVRYMTNILLLIISTWTFLVVSNQDSDFCKKVFRLMVILFSLNAISLSIIPKQYLWIKWGLPVKIFDQSDPVLAWGLLFLMVMNFEGMRKNVISLLALMYVTYGSAFKSVLELTVSVPLGMLLLKLKKLSKSYFVFYLLFYGFFVVLIVIFIGYFKLEHSIVTRYYQIINFFRYLQDNFYFIFIGFGPEKAFYTYIQYPYDPGAWSLMEKDSPYKRALQVPFLNDFRNFGVIGIYLKFLIIYKLMELAIKGMNFSYWKAFLLSYIALIFVKDIVPWSPKISIYMGFFLALLMRDSLYLNHKEIKWEFNE